MKKDIENREDIILMVNSFYDKVNLDNNLSHIFNNVAKLNWKKHLPKMYDFWETLLFEKITYSGNPMKTHRKVNDLYAFKSEDFERWIKLFNANIDKHFEGEKVEFAKQRALQIATVTQIKLEKKNNIF